MQLRVLCRSPLLFLDTFFDNLAALAVYKTLSYLST